MDPIDVAIIGGGPAGLTAANTLARQAHTAVIFDSKTYRNAAASHMHMVLTWDHKSPAGYKTEARENILANYSSIQFADVGVSKIEKLPNSHFNIQDASGKTWTFRKVILAVGSTDIYPGIEGYDKLWGKRIFHCLFCKGFEERGPGSSGVLAVPPVSAPLAAHMALNGAQLTDTVTIYTNGDENVTTEIRSAVATLVESKFAVETRKIKRLLDKGGDAISVEFEDGSVQDERFLVHNPETRAQGPFVEQLGLDTTPSGDIKADYPFWGTSVPGVYAVGDCSTPYKVIPSAITSGCNAAVAVAAELQSAKYTK
ncbi:hypothetical protein B0I35DRAFT_381475 [Stachybotrys elegans]|uniref:FAD/NAD(P)-binding domain-containing protein n=1 Tax=Stachybotrys elegans TaxID=80388 RepID=A0A8K0SGY9_9HYPO|nr:hypothetical protein B0I35DRAFT_381475 [Stachybotrys elegans]